MSPGRGEGSWVEEGECGGNESWCISGPCADHQEEVATGSQAIFTGTPQPSAPKMLAQEIPTFPVTFQLTCKWHMC